MKYLTNVDLTGNELQNAVIQPLATAPTGKLGQIYYNSTTNGLYQHNGTQWVLVGVKYDLQAGTLTSNSIPIELVGTDGSTDSVTLVGAGDTTLSKSGNTITITTSASTSITYTFTGAASATGYVVTITPSTGTAQTVTIGLASATDAGLMSPTQYSKLDGIASGAEVNVQSDWNQSTFTADDYIKNKPTLGGAAAKDVDSSITSGSTSTDLPTSSAVASFVSTQIGAADAMRFKGTIGTGGDISTLPTTGVKVGDTYMVTTAGTYDSKVCEVGDLIIATATTPTWTVAQTNINGAVTAPLSTTVDCLALFTGSRQVGNGPKIGSGTTTFLRNDGTWQIPECIERDFLTIPAGSTSVSLSDDEELVTWDAEMDHQAVMVDFKYDINTDRYVWSIAASQSSTVYIDYYVTV